MSKKTVEGKESRDDLIRLIDRGAEILAAGAAAVTSGAVALLLGEGPEAKAIGGLASKGIEIVLRDVGTDISSRQLGRREEIRVGAALIIAAAEIKRRQKNGELLRDDGFFDKHQGGRSDAGEVLESVLLKAQREAEEKKIRHLGLLYSSIPFDSDISLPYANQLLKVAEQLTYRQLCIPKLCDEKDNYNLRDEDYRDQDVDKKDLYQVLQVLYECAELDNKQYINPRGKADLHGREFADFGATIDGLTRAIPSCMSLQGLGKDLFNLMKLSLIPDEDIAPIAEQLK